MAYVLINYEILRQNRAMAIAAGDSAKMMEQSLRFSYSANVLFSTIVTKEPGLRTRSGCSPIQSEDYLRALREHVGAGQRTEFVFAVLRNAGPGVATGVKAKVTYHVLDSANPNKRYSVTKEGNAQILERDRALALLVYVSLTPTTDDIVELVEAKVSANDFYRQARGEVPQEQLVDRTGHSVEADPSCILTVR